MKKFLCVCLAVALAFCASGCRFLASDYSSLLTAPKSPGDLNEIQNVLNRGINGEYTLQYPAEGKYRSAMVQYDLNADGLREAFVFYGTDNDDGTQTMHLAFISYIGSQWSVKSDLQVVAAGIKFIDFCDLNDDGVYEVIAGWENYNSLSGVLTVYCFEKDSLIQRVRDDYLAYLVCDLDEDRCKELFLVNGQRPLLTANTYSITEKPVVAACVYKLEESEIRQIGRCGLDTSAERYAQPKYANIAKDKKAIIIDGYVSGGGMITEALVWENDSLSNLFYDSVTGQNKTTYRISSIRSVDYNEDGIVEIPQMQQLPTPSSTAGDAVYLTKWTQFTKEGLNSVSASIVNTVDGYYLDIPSEWDNKITIVRKMDSMERIIYAWDAKNFLLSDEIFRVKLFDLKDWQKQRGDTEWTELKRDETHVYASIVNEDSELPFSIKKLKNGLHLISEWEREE